MIGDQLQALLHADHGYALAGLWLSAVVVAMVLPLLVRMRGRR